MWAYQSKKWKWKRKYGNLKEKVAKEREREKGGRMGGVTVNCVGVEAKRSSTLDLSALGCSALHRAVSKESTARQTLPPVKTFHKIFPRKTLSGIQHEWKLRYSYLQRRKLLCAHCWKDVFQARSSSVNVAKKILNRSARNLNTEVISLIFRLERCSPAATSLLVFLFGRGGGAVSCGKHRPLHKVVSRS